MFEYLGYFEQGDSMNKVGLLIIASCFLLGGCCNKESVQEVEQGRIVSEEKIVVAKQEIQQEVYQEINIESDRMLETINVLCKAPRKFGSDEEKETITYLEKQLLEWGYTTARQEITVFENISEDFAPARRIDNLDQVIGQAFNLIGEIKSNYPTEKTLVISAHHDTGKNTVGVFDNATGVAAVLEVARQVSGYQLPFNIRVIFFGAEEEGCVGSRDYLNSLDEHELKNIIGLINVDMVGEKDANPLFIGVQYARDNSLSIAFNNYWQDQRLGIRFYMISDDYYAVKHGIPAISLSNKTNPLLQEETYEAQMEQLDIQITKQAAEMMAHFIVDLELEDIETIVQADQIEIDMEDYEILKTSSRYDMTQFKVEDFVLSNVAIKCIENGATSSVIYTFANEQGEKYRVEQISNKYFEKEDLSHFEKIDVNESVDLFRGVDNEGEKVYIYREVYGMYYGKIIGDIIDEEYFGFFE